MPTSEINAQSGPGGEVLIALSIREMYPGIGFSTMERYKDRKRLNYVIIEGNLAEAIAQLQVLREDAKKHKLGEVDFQIGLQHAYHHLNFAWHIRHVTTQQYKHLTTKLFNLWGRYPKIPCYGERKGSKACE